jgi:hypothetical protein
LELNIPAPDSNSKSTIPHHPSRRFVASPKPPANKNTGIIDMSVGLKNFSQANGAPKTFNASQI